MKGNRLRLLFYSNTPLFMQPTLSSIHASFPIVFTLSAVKSNHSAFSFASYIANSFSNSSLVVETLSTK